MIAPAFHPRADKPRLSGSIKANGVATVTDVPATNTFVRRARLNGQPEDNDARASAFPGPGLFGINPVAETARGVNSPDSVELGDKTGATNEGGNKRPGEFTTTRAPIFGGPNTSPENDESFSRGQPEDEQDNQLTAIMLAAIGIGGFFLYRRLAS